MNATNENKGFILPRVGFTLIEMLVVLAILGILMAMMIPAAGLILRRTRNSTAQGDASVVVATLLKYRMEYNRWPDLAESSAEPDSYETDVKWVEVMSPRPDAERTTANFNKITFFEGGGGALAPATKPDGTPHPHAGAFVDPWGTPFIYKVDVDGDGSIPSPDPNADKPVQASVVAWSAGADGLYETWEDNATSWE